MKISQKLLQERCGLIQPKFAKHIDLSHCNIVTLEGLKTCYNLQTCILRHNSLSVVSDVIGALTELWKLDLSHNLICSLDGLLKVRCIGTLVLSYNNLTWEELRKIQHMIILDLRLVGNPNLEKDPYYRRHVIDSLPHVWMLDGILIPAPERGQVAKFFQNSEVLDRPVRRKLRPISATRFVPTHIKKLANKAVLGKAGLHLMCTFSQNEKQTLETDCRRIRYIAETLENDLAIQRSYWSLLHKSGCLAPESSSPIPAYMSHQTQYLTHSSTCNTDKPETEEGSDEGAPRGFGAVPPLIKLLNCRVEELEKCNMLLLLLVAGLEFSLPLSLLEETLHTANLSTIGDVDCLALLQLPHNELLLACSVLFSSVIIDRGRSEQGGLYKRLFVSLYVVLANLLRTTHGSPNRYQLKYMSPALHRSLLAAEVVQLMCLVPSFIDMIERDQGVLDLVAIATQNPHIKDLISDILWNNESPSNDFEEVTNTLLHFVRLSIDNNHYELVDLEPGLVPYHRPLSAVSIPSNRNIHRRAKSGVASRRMRSKGTVRVPQLGDMVCLPRQRKGRVIGLHQDQLALIQISALPVSPLKEACGEYVYVDMQFMKFDVNNKCWVQQEHVQEYPPPTRIIENTEKCYSVVSSSDYNKWSYKEADEEHTTNGQTSEQDRSVLGKQSAENQLGEAYYVHENKQLHLDVDEEVVKYMKDRPVLPETPGLNGVFAPEEDVQVKVTPHREAVPVMKEVLDYVTDQNINKHLEHEKKSQMKTHISAVNVTSPAMPLFKTTLSKPSQLHNNDDPDMMHPTSNIKVLPMSSATPLSEHKIGINNKTLPEQEVARTTRSNPPDWAWSVRSMRRPNTRASLRSRHSVRSSTSHSRAVQHPPEQTTTEYNLFTKQKSLPDVSGISLFAYSMGGVGFIKPPDITDHLATCRAKDLKSQKYKIRPSKLKI